jgi:hypothetical protein
MPDLAVLSVAALAFVRALSAALLLADRLRLLRRCDDCPRRRTIGPDRAGRAGRECREGRECRK